MNEKEALALIVSLATAHANVCEQLQATYQELQTAGLSPRESEFEPRAFALLCDTKWRVALVEGKRHIAWASEPSDTMPAAVELAKPALDAQLQRLWGRLAAWGRVRNALKT